VPGVCFVGTVFVHVNLIPVVPLRSYVILEPCTYKRHVGLRIPLSWKSVLMGWLRAGLLLTAGASCGLAFYSLKALADQGEARPVVVSVAVMAAAFALFVLCMCANRAGYDRAVELGALLGIEPLEIEQTLASSQQSLRDVVRWYGETCDQPPLPLPSPPQDPMTAQT
jgi:hypothetical protein